MNILGMGPVEVMVVVVIALLVMGPERMGSTVRTFGRLTRDFRRTSDGFRRTFQELLDEPDRRPGPGGAGGSGGARPSAGAQSGKPPDGEEPLPPPADPDEPPKDR